MEDQLVRLEKKYPVDFWDYRYWEVENTSLELREREVKKAYKGHESSFSVRVILNGAWGFSAGTKLNSKELQGVFLKSRALALNNSRHTDKKVILAPNKWERATIKYRPKIDPRDVAIQEKYKMIEEMNKVIMENNGIHTVSTSYSDGWMKEKIINSEGAFIEEEIPRVVIQSNITAKNDKGPIGYRTRIGSTKGMETFLEQNPIQVGQRSAEKAVGLLKAKAPPSGRFPVIADPELTGVFVHEAIGHATEADTVLSGESILEGRIDQRLGTEIVTIIDDPTIPGGFGSFKFDDEGVRARKKIIIKDGVLKEYIHSLETAGIMGFKPNGGARAESAHVRPLVRMSNTLLEAGTYGFDELFEDIKFGIYAKGTRGGQVDPIRGTFQFNAQEAYLIEKGRITTPLRDVSLSGMILETLNYINALEKVSKLGSPGFCGKGQLVPVGNGGPHMRISNIYVGGGN